MSATLSNDDRCVVDLILDRPSDAEQEGPINSCFTTAPTAELQARITKVEQFLHTLDAHPVPEPARDLLARTLARCKQGDLPTTPGELIEPAGFRQQL